MTGAGYRLVLPAPWVRVALDGGLEGRVAELMDGAMASIPKQIPPDQALPMRRRAEADLLAQLRAARDASGIDAYFPAGLMHGLRVHATFIVSSSIPDSLADEEMAARVTASFLADAASTPVSIDDTIWVRRERDVAETADPGQNATPAVRFDARRVEYRAPVPDEPRRWISVVFTTGGDGDLSSRSTALIVDLFDAIMKTWRWSPDALSGPVS